MVVVVWVGLAWRHSLAPRSVDRANASTRVMSRVVLSVEGDDMCGVSGGVWHHVRCDWWRVTSCEM